MNLLVRLYDVSDGEILIDGVNVKDMSFEQLRRNVAIVSQETYLFTGTIFENIAYSIKDASYEDVINASIEAGAHDFIVKLPDGYETRIGFGNRDLSGGERQRISIARALLKKPRILILDDSTSAVDTATEAMIRKALREDLRDSTKIIIAQRISSVMDADTIVVMDDGKITGIGSHAELLAYNSEYRAIYVSQTDKDPDVREGA